MRQWVALACMVFRDQALGCELHDAVEPIRDCLSGVLGKPVSCHCRNLLAKIFLRALETRHQITTELKITL